MAGKDEPGERFIVTGRVVDGTTPLAGVSIYVFHADANEHSNFFYADRGYSPPSKDETIRRYGNLFPPGKVFKYSNLGYGILDYIIERVSGLPYAEFMRKEVFAPMGLTPPPSRGLKGP